MPFLIEDATDARAEINLAAGGAPVVLGSLARSPVSDRWRNALIGLDKHGTPASRYDKSHLVPFGEYMPLGTWMQRLGVMSIAGRGLGTEPGAPPRPLIFAGLPAFTPLICYEGVFPREVRAASVGADWIVLITNDAWFGQWAGPAQHLAQAQMRAIETGLPVARAANTGISAMISPFGELEQALPFGGAGFIDAPLQRPISATLYSRFGTAISLLVSFFVFLLASGNILLNKRRH